MQTNDLRSIAAELQASFGLINELIAELDARAEGRGTGARLDELVAALRSRTSLMRLPSMLLRAHVELGEALGGLRVSRELLQAQAIDRLKASQGKLTEVNSTAETAAMAIMEGVDQALGLVEQVNPADDAGRTAQDGLRDALMGLYNHLQFQDITAQQVMGVASNLEGIEHRLESVALLFDGQVPSDDRLRAAVEEVRAVDSTALPYNPDATFQSATERQADIDAAVAAAAAGRAPAA